METLILIVWWLGLLGALVLTAVVLKQVFLVVGVLRNVLMLAQSIGTAAEGVGARVATAAQLDRAAAAALAVENATAPLAAACARLRDGLLGGTEERR